MKHVRVGLIGCGNITSTIHLPILKNITLAEVEFIADLEKPIELGADFGVRALDVTDIAALPECDLVFLATPVGVREAYIREFGKRGTFVFTEKPFAVSVEQHKEFLQISALASCNYMKTTFGAIEQIRRIVNEKLFGSLQNIYISEGGIIGATGKPNTHYQTDIRLSGGGILIERGCHTLSQLVHFLHGADFEVRGSDIKWLDGLDIDVKADLLASSDSMVTVSYHVSMIQPVTNIMLLRFEHAVVSFDHTDPASQLLVSSKSGEIKHLLAADTRYPLNLLQAFYMKWRAVIDALMAGSEIDKARETSLTTTRLIESIYSVGGRLRT